MSDLAGQWVGTVYGTNTGNVFMDIEDADGSLTGTIHINEAGTGVIVYTFTGVSNDTVELQLTPNKAPDGVALAVGTATALVQPDGSLTGRWETDLGTAGTFQVYRHNALRRTESLQQSPPAVPEQAFFHTASIGAVRLYKPDLRKLLEAIARDFVQGKPTVTYTDRGTQVTKFADAFLQEDPAHPLKSLKISIQEPEPSGVTKLAAPRLEGAASEVSLIQLVQHGVEETLPALSEVVADRGGQDPDLPGRILDLLPLDPDDRQDVADLLGPPPTTTVISLKDPNDRVEDRLGDAGRLPGLHDMVCLRCSVC